MVYLIKWVEAVLDILSLESKVEHPMGVVEVKLDGLE
jgi:hypothetical protein